MRNEVQRIVIAVAFLLWISSSYTSSQAEIPHSETWVFMVYSCADCDLEGYQLGYFFQMASVGSTAGVSIVVQMDRIAGDSSSHGDWTDCKRFYVTQGLTPTGENAVDSLGEVNMGDPKTLADFLEWAVQEYPADHYFAMLIGHGWIDGVCPDWSNEDLLTPLEIRWALSQVRNTTGVKIEVIGIEGCQQAALEIAYEIGDCVDLIIASEDVSTHWPYWLILSDLVSAHDTMNSSSLASMVVDYYSQYSWRTGGDIMTLSAFNLSRIKTQVAPAVTRLADALIANITRFAHSISRAASRAESHKPLYSIEEAASCRDLYDFALKVKQEISDASIQLAAQNLITAIEGACIAEWHGNGHPHFHGLYIYLPHNAEVYSARTRIYDKPYSAAHPLWTQDTMWDNFLTLLFKTYAAGLRSREQIIDSFFTPLDSNNDSYVDALHVTLNVCTTGEPIDVTARGFLIDPRGDIVDQCNCTWTVDRAGGFGDIYLHMPSDGEGLYTATIEVYDQQGIFEDEICLQQQFDNVPPATTHDYDGAWHNSDVLIALSTDDQGSGVNETCYRVNDGQTKTVGSDGQPLITTEGAENKIEYWSTDRAGNEEQHHVLADIRLDKTKPSSYFEHFVSHLSVAFDASASTDNIDIASYEWDFGDGNAGIGKSINNTYEKAGIYAVVLTVKDLAGNTDVKSISISVPSQSQGFPLWIIAASIGGVAAVGFVVFYWKKLRTNHHRGLKETCAVS